MGLAYQAFKISVSADSAHAESFNNLGVLELRKNSLDQARANFRSAQRLTEFLFQPYYNGALLAYKTGELQDSYHLVQKALEAYPEHHDSLELLRLLKKQFSEA